LPEVPFHLEKFLEDVQTVHGRLGYAVVVMSEGIRGEDGKPLVESGLVTDMDSFGHRQLGGIGQYIANVIAEKLNIKARCDKPGTIQRSSMLCASTTDLEEAYLVGKMAVRYAVEGKSGSMVTLQRAESPEYQIETGLVELGKVANKVRKFPSEFITRDHNYVTQEFIKYFTPLLGGEVPSYVKLRKIPVSES
jgi:6-phosphofructokinase 1